MKTNILNSTIIIALFIIVSLILSSVVFSVGNKKNIEEIVKSDSIISDFFAVNSISDGLINDILGNKNHKQSKEKDDKQQVNKEINITVPALSLLFNLEEVNKEFFNGGKIINFILNREIQYPLKIPFDREFILLILLLGLIFTGLARSVPVVLNIKSKKLILGSLSIGFFYLRGIYENI